MPLQSQNHRVESSHTSDNVSKTAKRALFLFLLSSSSLLISVLELFKTFPFSTFFFNNVSQEEERETKGQYEMKCSFLPLRVLKILSTSLILKVADIPQHPHHSHLPLPLLPGCLGYTTHHQLWREMHHLQLHQGQNLTRL